jgi:MoaA/NifB/PqqE/SkfB family radical SAM enzyme
MILTNGVTITPDKTDILLKHERIISGINFNTPAIEREEWKKQAGFNSDKLYDRLIENIDYVIEKFPERVKNKNISVGMNGINEHSFVEVGGWIEKGEDMFVSNDTLKEQFNLFKEKYPQLQIYMNPSIVDRDGLLDKNNIISLKEGNKRHNVKGKEVIGCRNGSQSFKKGELTGRPFGWIHISSLGDLFLCCQDFHINSKFGNIVEQPLSELWRDEKHVDLIYDSFQTVCADCNFAQWG